MPRLNGSGLLLCVKRGAVCSYAVCHFMIDQSSQTLLSFYRPAADGSIIIFMDAIRAGRVREREKRKDMWDYFYIIPVSRRHSYQSQSSSSSLYQPASP